MKEVKLLDEIALTLGKVYLSDLHAVKIEDFIIAVKKIDMYKYPIDQWNYAMSYIIGSNIQIKSIEEIENVLIRACLKNKN